MSQASSFREFWARYPRKVARLAAERAYVKALRVASHEAIMAGLEAYRLHLPVDPQFIPHAASWLNAGRWDDEFEVDVQVERPVIESRATCRHEPKCPSNEWHLVILAREQQARGAA